MLLFSPPLHTRIHPPPLSLPQGMVQITWDSPRELEEYISKLQGAAERLTSENRRLRKCHGMLTDKVCVCMCVCVYVCARVTPSPPPHPLTYTPPTPSQVVQLMGVDLLRQQQHWKDSLMEIRHVIASLIQVTPPSLLSSW